MLAHKPGFPAPAETSGPGMTRRAGQCASRALPATALDAEGDPYDLPDSEFAGQDFHLTIASPCMNSGLNQPWTDGRALDIANRPRIDRFSGRVDMGCYEYIPKGILYKVR